MCYGCLSAGTPFSNGRAVTGDPARPPPLTASGTRNRSEHAAATCSTLPQIATEPGEMISRITFPNASITRRYGQKGALSRQNNDQLQSWSTASTLSLGIVFCNGQHLHPRAVSGTDLWWRLQGIRAASVCRQKWSRPNPTAALLIYHRETFFYFIFEDQFCFFRSVAFRSRMMRFSLVIFTTHMSFIGFKTEILGQWVCQQDVYWSSTIEIPPILFSHPSLMASR